MRPGALAIAVCAAGILVGSTMGMNGHAEEPETAVKSTILSPAGGDLKTRFQEACHKSNIAGPFVHLKGFAARIPFAGAAVVDEEAMRISTSEIKSQEDIHRLTTEVEGGKAALLDWARQHGGRFKSLAFDGDDPDLASYVAVLPEIAGALGVDNVVAFKIYDPAKEEKEAGACAKGFVAKWSDAARSLPHVRFHVFTVPLLEPPTEEVTKYVRLGQTALALTSSVTVLCFGGGAVTEGERRVTPQQVIFNVYNVPRISAMDRELRSYTEAKPPRVERTAAGLLHAAPNLQIMYPAQVQPGALPGAHPRSPSLRTRKKPRDTAIQEDSESKKPSEKAARLETQMAMRKQARHDLLDKKRKEGHDKL